MLASNSNTESSRSSLPRMKLRQNLKKNNLARNVTHPLTPAPPPEAPSPNKHILHNDPFHDQCKKPRSHHKSEQSIDPLFMVGNLNPQDVEPQQHNDSFNFESKYSKKVNKSIEESQNTIKEKKLNKINLNLSDDTEALKFSSLFQKDGKDPVAETPFTKSYKKEFLEYVLKKDVSHMKSDEEKEQEDEKEKESITEQFQTPVFDFTRHNVFKDGFEKANSNNDKQKNEFTLKKMHHSEYFKSKPNSDEKNISLQQSQSRYQPRVTKALSLNKNFQEIRQKKMEEEKEESGNILTRYKNSLFNIIPEVNYNLGMTLFFSFIKSSIVLFTLSFIIFAFLSIQYLMNFDDSRVMYPDLNTWDGAYLRAWGLNGGRGRNSENGIGAWISVGLWNVGKIGASKWRFYEFAIDDFGNKTLRAKWGMNWDWADSYYKRTNTTLSDYASSTPSTLDQSKISFTEDTYINQTANGTVRFGIARLEQDTSLSFNHHISECNINSEMQNQLIKCHKQLTCEIEFTEDWFDEDCLDQYRKQSEASAESNTNESQNEHNYVIDKDEPIGYKFYLKFQANDGVKGAFLTYITDAEYNTFFSIVASLIFVCVALQPYLLKLRQKWWVEYTKVHKPQQRDFSILLQNLPSDLSAEQLRTRVLAHMRAKPSETEMVGRSIRFHEEPLPTERVELARKTSSLALNYVQNEILDHGKIIDVFVSTNAKIYQNYGKIHNYDYQIETLYDKLRNLVKDKCRNLPKKFSEKFVNRTIEYRYSDRDGKERTLLRAINGINHKRKNLFEENLKQQTFPSKDTGAAIVTFETVAMRDKILKQLKAKNSQSIIMDFQTMQVQVPGNPVQINWRSLEPGYPWIKKFWKRFKYQAKSYGYILALEFNRQKQSSLPSLSWPFGVIQTSKSFELDAPTEAERPSKRLTKITIEVTGRNTCIVTAESTTNPFLPSPSIVSTRTVWMSTKDTSFMKNGTT